MTTLFNKIKKAIDEKQMKYGTDITNAIVYLTKDEIKEFDTLILNHHYTWELEDNKLFITYSEQYRNLTLTENKIVDMIVNEGLTNRQIGERLGIAEGTIRTHMGKILIKLNIKSRKELKRL